MNNSADICKFVWYLYEKRLWPWWSQSWNLIKLKIPVTRKEFEPQMYVGTSSSKVLEFGTVGQEEPHLVEIFQLWDLSLTLMSSCPRFTRKKGHAKMTLAIWEFELPTSYMLNSFMTEVSIIQKPVHWFAEQINGLVSIWYRPPSWKR